MLGQILDLISIHIQLLQGQQLLWHSRKFRESIACQLNCMQHSILVLKEIFRQNADVIVVGVERSELMTLVEPFGHFSQLIVAHINMTNVLRKWFYDQPEKFYDAILD